MALSWAKVVMSVLGGANQVQTTAKNGGQHVKPPDEKWMVFCVFGQARGPVPTDDVGGGGQKAYNGRGLGSTDRTKDTV